jgi:hypothetical protein
MRPVGRAERRELLRREREAGALSFTDAVRYALGRRMLPKVLVISAIAGSLSVLLPQPYAYFAVPVGSLGGLMLFKWSN